MKTISKKEAKKLVDEVSRIISEGGELPVVNLTRIFDFVLADNPVMIPVKEVCNDYRVGVTQVYEWFKRGLTKESCGGTKIRIVDLEQFIAEGKA